MKCLSCHSHARRPAPHRRPRRWFLALLAGYTFEGIGYVIAGTFLVAAIQQSAGGGPGGAPWILVGLAALPSCSIGQILGPLLTPRCCTTATTVHSCSATRW
ncbi:YbfB/YjiJ family MFS transporter [Streptomyces eurythermus]|uniref:YbfB/YjiJ family MFS transporter n=1 Tax=Streptomyces eurythermus TaxID=42237 RepID=UPI0033C648C5